jgi:hypothetical protein
MHEAGLPDAGNPFEQHVPPGEKRCDGVREKLLVPDDPASDFLGDPGKALAELIDVLGNWRSSSHFFRMK